jgi:hypothetical protein
MARTELEPDNHLVNRPALGHYRVRATNRTDGDN